MDMKNLIGIGKIIGVTVLGGAAFGGIVAAAAKSIVEDKERFTERKMAHERYIMEHPAEYEFCKEVEKYEELESDRDNWKSRAYKAESISRNKSAQLENAYTQIESLKQLTSNGGSSIMNAINSFDSDYYRYQAIEALAKMNKGV